MKCCTD